MKVHTATLAGGDNNQDRVFVTDNAIIVLDGASAFEPVDLDAGLYAETLGAVIAEHLAQSSSVAVADAVALAIAHAVRKLGLTPGRSPSSTVSILRTRPGVADLYVLGDSPIHYGVSGDDCVLVDHRLSNVAPKERERYISALRAGSGFGTQHRESLAALQRIQCRNRNRVNGYWIAEAVPDAAHHAITETLDTKAITWAALATDGAANFVDHRGYRWAELARHDSDQLATLLAGIHRWESINDPDGSELPRAKQHDDKTLATIRL